MRILPLATLLLFGLLGCSIEAAEPAATKANTARGDKMLAEYFKLETAKLAQATFADIHTIQDWTSRRPEYLRQLHEMLGLDPLPDRTPLHAETTGKIDADGFTVEKVVFQSRPQLYVTANLYLPKNATGPVPAILYLCGHGREKEGDISYGNKTHYQHHGTWFAKHGYACLTLDTLQLGEIEGIHHGTKLYDMWWWVSRGYTPAGVEAWNGIRALDYLQSRPEVDGERIGLTGRSGGGASSWYLAALDERVKVAVPVAGIADLEAHVVDGVVEGHCDCMFMLNTYRWDYGRLAALVAPRPLLLANSDKDKIFPLESIERIHQQVRRIYRLYGADDKFGLQISEGPHLDTQELQVAAFRWFDRFLMKVDRPIDPAQLKLLERPQLKVLDALPNDSVNATIQETFVPLAPKPEVPADAAAWAKQRDAWMTVLREKCFRGWPEEPGPLDVKLVSSTEHDGKVLKTYEYTSQPDVRLRMYVEHKVNAQTFDSLYLSVLDKKGWNVWLDYVESNFPGALVEEMQAAVRKPLSAEQKKPLQRSTYDSSSVWIHVPPRGVGLTLWDQNPKKQTEICRRFMLLGQTVEGMQVWDARRAVQAARSIPEFAQLPANLQGFRLASGTALYASLFEPAVKSVSLDYLVDSHLESPCFLNVLRYLDVPQAVAMALERSDIHGVVIDKAAWKFPQRVAMNLNWTNRLALIETALETEGN